MSGFLANLAGLALGQPPLDAARLSLPPRFSGSVQIDTDAGLEQVETAPARSIHPPLSAQPPSRSKDRPVLPATPIVTTVSALASPSPEQPAARTTVPVTRQAEPPRSMEREVIDRPSPSPLHVTKQAQAIHSTTEKAAVKRNSPIRSETVVRHIRSDVSSPQAAPLTQAALANRTIVNREPPPVVNVTIDRLEVLAPREAAKSQMPRRTRPQPSVSLADYLGTRS
jgi:hypothetical protein